MKQIIEANNLINNEELIINNENIVLVGGCFDILHLGHIVFLEKAKKEGDILVILLESDENIKKNKGQNRPINSQENRAVFLTKLKMVDYVIKLPEMKNDEEYLEIISKIKPKVIAVSDDDKNLIKKKKQAKKIGAKLIKVTNIIPHQSTSRIIEIIKI
ncbi:MAG: adenylyltransferase/cytidyltransferase family protein [Candidatus Shapirobacteria bacterium]|nr:adenylyltransferase/cytidyltransferase family protein [Candidatus Shapirobacteria bacterium]MDD4410147.1 adenylyltransferase/cytidyltransferase family protein [Candidatus Shapirobacteria bacterium]